MRIYNVIWKNRFAEKIAAKHNITIDEVEDVLFSKPHIRISEKGKISGENLYVAYGQIKSGRYLIIFFILKHKSNALPISARDMTSSERRYYNEQKETN